MIKYIIKLHGFNNMGLFFFSDKHLNVTALHDYATQNQSTNPDQQLQTTDESTQTEITVEEIKKLMAENLTIL